MCPVYAVSKPGFVPIKMRRREGASMSRRGAGWARRGSRWCSGIFVENGERRVRGSEDLVALLPLVGFVTLVLVNIIVDAVREAVLAFLRLLFSSKLSILVDAFGKNLHTPI